MCDEVAIDTLRDHLAQNHQATFRFLVSSDKDRLLDWHKHDHTVIWRHNENDFTPTRLS